MNAETMKNYLRTRAEIDESLAALEGAFSDRGVYRECQVMRHRMRQMDRKVAAAWKAEQEKAALSLP